MTTNDHELERRTEPLRIPDLVNDLTKDDGRVRTRAREELARVGEPAVPRLAALLADDRWRTRWEAAKTLQAIGSENAAGPLARLLNDEKSSVRWVAAEALLELGPCALEDVLRAAIRCSGSARFREAAHHVLKGLEDERAKAIAAPVVEAVERSDGSGAVILAARRCLDELHALCPGD